MGRGMAGGAPRPHVGDYGVLAFRLSRCHARSRGGHRRRRGRAAHGRLDYPGSIRDACSAGGRSDRAGSTGDRGTRCQDRTPDPFQPWRDLGPVRNGPAAPAVRKTAVLQDDPWTGALGCAGGLLVTFSAAFRIAQPGSRLILTGPRPSGFSAIRAFEWLVSPSVQVMNQLPVDGGL